MAADDKHTISLVVEAKNLSSEKLEAVARDIDGLGKHAIKTEKALNDLKLDQKNLDSFEQMGEHLEELRNEMAKAEVAFKDQSKSLDKNAKDYDQQRIALEKSRIELKQQRKELRSTQTTYDNLAKKVNAKKKATESEADYQKRLTQATEETTAEIKRLNQVYAEQVKKVRAKISVQKEDLANQKAADAAADKAAAQQKRQADADQKAADAKAELNRKLDEYQIVMARLTAERDKGVISTKDYILEEVKLRDRLELSSAAVRDRIKTLEAEAKEVKDTAKAKEKAYQDEVEAIQRKNKALADEVDAILAAERAEEAALDKNHIRTRVQNIKKYEAAIKELMAAKERNDISSAEFNNAERKIRQELKLTEKQAKKTQLAIASSGQGMGRAAKATDALTHVTRRLAQAYTVLIAAQGATSAVTNSVQAYGDLEKAMIGVEKTTGASRQELEQMTEALVEMSKDVTPTAATELANMATVAGQLGVKGADQITKLVATVDALENSTNLAGEEAATLLTRILNLSGEGVDNIDRLGSVFVELGNNFAVAEDEIAHMTQEIITGTTAIDLGAASAAAFGAALKVSGQQAERSRSAMFRLSQGIKSAVLEGGDALQDLSAITGMTADELEKNLGERPQDVLLATIQGFAKVRDEGGLLTDVLSRMGIEGVESTAVLEALAKNVGTLEEMLAASSEQWEHNNALMDEALKAYASQDAAIGRLVNTFEDLKVKIGEALADETEQTINDFTAAIENGEGAVVSLVEDLVNMAQGLREVIGGLDLMVEGLFGIESAWSGVYNIMRSGINAITYLIKGLTVGLHEWVLTFKSIGGASEESMDKTRKAIAKLKKSMEEDLNDIAEAAEDMKGRSSDAYRDLVKATDDYSDVLGKLTQEERDRLKELNTTLKGERELDGERRKLTATLVSLGRQEELRAANAKRQAEADEKQRIETEKNEAAKAKLEKRLESLGLTHEQVTAEIKLMKSALDAGIAVSDEFHDRLKLLETAEQRFADAAAAANDKTKEQTYDVQELTDAELDLIDSIEDQTRALREIERQLEDTTIKGKARLELLRDQKKATDQLNDTTKKLALTRELEAKTNSQLLIEQRNHNLELEILERRYRAGTITAGEFAEQKQQLGIKTQILNSLILDSASSNDKDAASTNRNAAAKEKLAEAQEKANAATKKSERLVDENGKKTQQATTYTSLYAQAQQYLKKEFDYTSHSVEELGERYDELQGKINLNRRVTSRWWIDTAKAWNKAFEREQRIVSETKTMLKWTKQVERGSLSLSELADMARQTDTRFRHLDENDLSGLRSAIDAASQEIRQAQEETKQFAETVEDALNSAKDKLYQLNDEREKSLNLQYDADIAELEMLKAQAEARGESTRISQIQEAIRLTEQARKKELENIAADRREEAQRKAEQQARDLERQNELAENQKEIDQRRAEQLNQYSQRDNLETNATIADLEQKIKRLEAAVKSAQGTGTTIVLQSGDRQAYINGVVDEVLSVLEQAGLRV